MRRIQSFVGTAIVGVAIFATASGGIAQIPHYTNGMTGTFGSAGNWNDDAVGMTLNSTDDEYSARFTALENVTVDRAWQRLVNIDAGTTLQVGIMGDDGSGNPNGTYLASGTLNFTGAGSFTTNVNFSSTALLTSGSVYHLVTKVPTIAGGQNFNINSGGGELIRTYDRAVDTNMQHVIRRADGGAWLAVLRNPYFVLG